MVAVAGCDGATAAAPEPPADAPSEVGVVRFALTSVPSNARCVRFTLTKDGKSTQQSFAVAPSGTANLSISGFAVGTTAVLGEALDAACTDVTTSTPPTWVSVPVNVTLRAGEIQVITLSLVPAAGVSANVAFQSLTDASAGPSFKAVNVGETGEDVAFTVKNIAPSATGTVTTALSGANASDFAITDNGCTGELEGDTACVIRVRFTPTALGARSAFLTLSSAPGGTVTISLNATGLGARLRMSLFDAAAPTAVNFGTVDTGTWGAPVTVMVWNDGNVTSGPLTLTLDGPDAADFIVPPASCTIAPRGSCWLLVRFAPTSFGDKRATLRATASPAGSVSIDLVGSGT